MPEQHRMLPGSHERGYGPECRCGASWNRWNDRCCAEDAAMLAGGPSQPTEEPTP